MVVTDIFYGQDFVKQFKKLPKEIQVFSISKEKLFKENPLHPSLRLHGLKGKLDGLFSISINLSYRIIFKRKENGNIIFISIGKHNIYKNL